MGCLDKEFEAIVPDCLLSGGLGTRLLKYSNLYMRGHAEWWLFPTSADQNTVAYYTCIHVPLMSFDSQYHSMLVEVVVERVMVYSMPDIHYPVVCDYWMIDQ